MATGSEVFLFTPPSISGCRLWLDGADMSSLTFSGSVVTQWRDKSGNGNNATSVNNPSYNTESNGVDFVRTSSQYFTLPDGTYPFDNSSYSYFYIFTPRNTVLGQTLTFGGSNNATAGDFGRSIGFRTGDAGTGTLQTYWFSYDLQTSTTFTLNVKNFAANFYTSGGSRSIWINFVQGASDTPSVARTQRSTWNLIGAAGSGASYSGFLDAQIHEYIVYNSQLPTLQRQQVEGYLAWKWGIQASLPANHPFRNYRPYANPPFPTQIPMVPVRNQNVFPFVPPQISGCQLWLDAADPTSILLNGSSVTQWNDKSGNLRHFVQPTLGNSPTYTTYLSYPAIRFTGASSQFLSNAYIQTGTGGRHTYLVFADVSTTANTYGNPVMFFMADGNATQGGDWRAAFDGANQYLSIDVSAGAKTMNITPSVTSMRTQLTMGLWGMATGATVSTAYVFGNGTQFTNQVVAFAGNPSINTQNSPPTRIGGGQTGYATFALYELIHYNVELTTIQRQQVEGYFAWKWGLVSSLPVGHPFRNRPIAPFSFTAVPRSLNASFWTPLQISGCSLWLDAADSSRITQSGMSVTQWRDKVNTIVMTTQGTTANATLVNGINGRQCIYFNNSASDSVYMSGTLANLLTGTAFYVFQAFNQRNVDWRPFATWWSGGQYPAYGYLGGTTVSTVGPYTTYASPNGTPTQVLTPGSNYVISYGWGGTTTRVTTNGSTLQIGSQVSYSSSTSTFWIGGDGTDAYSRITLYYGEILFYNSILSQSQRQQVEGYLAWKWGLQANLPSNHPFSKFPPI